MMLVTAFHRASARNLAADHGLSEQARNARVSALQMHIFARKHCPTYAPVSMRKGGYVQNS